LTPVGIGLMAAGVIWVIIYYLSSSLLLTPSLGTFNIGAAILLFLVGLTVSLVPRTPPSAYGAGNPASAAPTVPGPTASAHINGFALASFIVAFTGTGALLAVIFGHIARVQVHRTGERGILFATAGLTIGWLTLGLIFVFAFLILLT
jgi:hypothetical protein